VIVSEPSNPWVTGIEQLYSREFLSEARDRLTPRGVYCQWFHKYEVSDEAIALVLKTFSSVFDHVSVWQTNRADLMLLGFRDGELAMDVDRLARRAERPDFRASWSGSASPAFRAARARDRSARRRARRGAARPDPLALPPSPQLRGGRAFFVGHQGEPAVHGLRRAGRGRPRATRCCGCSPSA
jgi:hypothetical protein